MALDPRDFLAEHAIIAPPPNAGSQLIVIQRLSPYRHFRLTFNTSCITCWINYPFSNHGLGEGRKPVRTVPPGIMKMCRVHKRATSAFCGVCLRDALPLKTKPMVRSCRASRTTTSKPDLRSKRRVGRAERKRYSDAP